MPSTPLSPMSGTPTPAYKPAPPETLNTRIKTQSGVDYQNYLKTGTSLEKALKSEGEWKDITPTGKWPKSLSTPTTHQLKTKYLTAGGAEPGSLIGTTPLGIVTGIGSGKQTHKTQAAVDATAKPTKATNSDDVQTNYALALKSLLQPYTDAVGQLPAEFNTLIGQTHIGDHTFLKNSDTAVEQFAKYYSPGFNPGQHPNTTLQNQESVLTDSLSKIYGETGEYTKALSGLGTDLQKAETVAPYKSLITAMFNRIRYTDIYRGGTFEGAKTWPDWLKSIYTTGAGGVIPGAGVKPSLIPKIPGITAVTVTPTSTGSSSPGATVPS